MKQKIIYLAAWILSILIVNAQNVPSRSDNYRVKLFIDCGQANCDFNYIREKIPVTDFVRDRTQSDIHILITAHRATSGGHRYTVLFFGQNKWINNNDSLYFFTVPNSSDDDTRKQLVKIIQAGIVPYLAKAGQIDKLNFVFEKDTAKQNTSANIDKWNNWVFNIGGRVRLSGDKNYKEKDFAVNGSAGRVTERSKLEFSFFNSNAKNSYAIEDSNSENSLKTINNYLEAEQWYVKSISSKWSWAVESAFRKSSYDNLEYSMSAGAGIEYNIFPYKLSSSKFFALRGIMKATKRNYMEETVYNRVKEMLFSCNLGAYIYFTQPWGNISSSITWYNYLHDLSKNNLSLDANLQIKLFKGVSISFYGTGSLIKDQLSLPRQGATSQEVLLKLKALATNFNYYTGMRLNYRFGSKFNNFVNPRFTNGRY